MGCLKGLPYFSSSLLVYCLTLVASCCLASYSAPSSPAPFPSNLKIGALFAYNSTIGKVAEQMLQLAIQNVNNDSDLLPGIELQLELADSACDPIQGSASAVALVKKGVVAIVGPQSSVVSHIVAHIGRASRIPILSFGATDPSLSERQYPYFYRVAPSDAMQMEAVAALISHFSWEEVAVIYTDDDYGAHGASALTRSLQERGSRLVESSLISPGAPTMHICEELNRLGNTESRVFVLHTQQELGFRILLEASNLGMFASGYVWIATDLVASRIFRPNPDPFVVQSLQGLLGIHRYIPSSPQLHGLLARWQENYPADMQSLDLGNVNAYGLYAYDAVYAVAYAISSHLAQGHNLTFTEPYELLANFSSFRHLKVLESGAALRENLKNTMFDGTSGHIQFDEVGDIKDAVFEYNVVGENPVPVAYWTNKTGISNSPHQLLNTNSTPDLIIVWPGNSTDVPQGFWESPRNGTVLRIGVPVKSGYSELVGQKHTKGNSTQFVGFCIDVFETAAHNLSHAVSFEYVPKQLSNSNPYYDDMVSEVASQELDAIVGDLKITASRLKQVDFTQPFIESGLVVLVPRNDKPTNDRWAFLRPFSVTMWLAIIGSTALMGLIIFILEHQENEEFHGPIHHRVGFLLWFMFSTFFRTHREGTVSCLGRTVMILWLFVGLILTTSYTASLTAILTVQQLTPEIRGLDSLVKSNLPIGYQRGSFVENYLLARQVGPDRLKTLISKDSYKEALDKGPYKEGGVAAIVDELPYVQMFLQGNCDKYAIVGTEFEKSGWGFAFRKGSKMVEEMSEQILRMSETGELSRLHDNYIQDYECSDKGLTAQGVATKLDMKSFWVLFLIVGTIAFVSAMTYILYLSSCRTLRQRAPPNAEGTTRFAP